MFEYRWLDTALDRLAAISIASAVPGGTRMAAGVEQFNAQLAVDPLAIGESRGGGYRVAFPPLLMVYYHVDEANRRVRVTDVIRFGP